MNEILEPTSALDPESTLLVENTLKGRTCVWITHNPEQETRVATHSLVLRYKLEQDDDDDDATEISMATE
jgi:ABC-type phosphate transport system ATPase subunit